MKNKNMNFPEFLQLTSDELHEFKKLLHIETQLSRFKSAQSNPFHPPLELEENFYAAVRDGNSELVTDLIAQYHENILNVAMNSDLRWVRDNAISHITLLTRAAANGGMSTYRTNILSDVYIHSIELINDPCAILHLAYHAVYECLRYTTRYHDGRISKPVLDCINYIDLHLTEKMTLEGLSAQIGFSSRQLTRRFKTEMKCSIHQYIIEERLHAAIYMLNFTDWTIVEIAQALGFSSESHFIDVFRKNLFQTPYAYRKSALFLD